MTPLELTTAERRLLGAVALERGLERRVLVELGEPEGVVDSWLEREVASGLLIATAPARVVSLTLAPVRGTVYTIRAGEAQLVLRALHRDRQLAEIANATRAVLEARSVSDLNVALQAGKWDTFVRLSASAPGGAAEWLHASVCDPFDATWLVETWKGKSAFIAAHVLEDCAHHAWRCDDLLAWVQAFRGDATFRSPEIDEALAQHALLRGSGASLPAELAAGMSNEVRAGYVAAARFIGGDLEGARALVVEACAGRSTSRGSAPRCGSLTPLIALVLLSAQTEQATAAARKLVSFGDRDVERSIARAFRVLLKHRETPDDARRVDPPSNTTSSVWETLIPALTVGLRTDRPALRAGWAQHLVRRAIEWGNGGYLWPSRQALVLAAELDASYAREELERLGQQAEMLALAPRELQLSALVAPRPEWKRTLEALDAVSSAALDQVDARLRVTWYMDMTSCSLARPSVSGERLTLAALHDRRDELGDEDAKILACTYLTPDGQREVAPEAYEALIGHPRVVNGVRGHAAVEVVRGVCRVRTEEEGDQLRVWVDPEGARLGVNVVAESPERLVVYRVTPEVARVIDVMPRGLVLPKQHEGEVTRVLAKLARSVEVRSSHLGAEREVVANPTPCLRFAPASGAWLVQLGVRPFGAQGRFLVAGAGRAQVVAELDGQTLRCERDFVLERANVDAIIERCPTLHLDPTEEDVEEDLDSWVLGEAPVLTLLAELRDAGVPCDLEWPESASLRLRGQVTSKSLHGRLRSKKGWYLLTGGVHLDDVTQVALDELSRGRAIARGRFVRLPSGDYVEVERRLRRVVAALTQSPRRLPAKRRSAEVEIHAGAVPLLRELAATEGSIDVDPETTAWLGRVERMAGETFEVPAELNAELRPYQIEGFRWLCRLGELGLGACLADDMGLGKTLQILAYVLTRVARGPVIVVAPTSVCTNWVREIRRFAPSLEPVEFVGPERTNALDGVERRGGRVVVITSYALLQQDAATLAAIAWGTAILDEAQFIKNGESLRARAAFRLVAEQRVAATGTPVENHYGDLWSIFRFLQPGMLGEWPDFNRRFVKPVERDGDREPEVTLKQLIQPYVLRRMKRDVLTDLPPITEVEHEVRLSDDEAMRYALLRKQIHDKLFVRSDGGKNRVDVLSEITRLRRFCCHPRLVFPDADSECTKLRVFLDLVEELRQSDHRALVFSQYVDFLGLVREQLDERGFTYEYLDGSTPVAARQARVDAFQRGSAGLFLISLKAGGFGLNLTAADYVIHLDPWWNPAVQDQATDRAHRIGQSRKVTVYRLVTRDTIEEKIVALHRRKQGLAEAVLEGGERVAKLGADELLRLIEG